MSLTSEQAQWFGATFDQLVATVEQAVLGKTRTVRLTLTCMLSGGHLLLEDNPGTGKTSLARALANAVDGTHGRIQFTPDLLPSDVLGVEIFDPATREFRFHPGPVFTTILLADEINRASPKTQSALLEVMEEFQVTIDKTTHRVTEPFMVVATQNPIEQAGTYALPEAQLDRFLMKTSLGYPDHATTVALLADSNIRDRAAVITPIITQEVITGMTRMTSMVSVETAVLEYVSTIIEQSRIAHGVQVGASVRGGMALVRGARTWAAAQGRSYVLPDDIKDLAEPVLAHRIVLDPEAEISGLTRSEVVERLLHEIQPPRRRAA